VPRPYLLLVKPRLVCANLVAACGGFFLAGGGGTGLFFAVLCGTALLVASGCVCNNCIDRDIDREMARTRERPLPAGAVSPATAWAYGALLGFAGALVLLLGTNALCFGIVAAGFVVYVGVYSLLLKRRHSLLATLLGSLAGAAPPVAAYCAARGRFDGGAALLLAIFSLWQIPHAHAIALYRRDEYAAAGVPVVSLTRGAPATRRLLLGHIAAFVLVAPLLTVGGYAGYAYFAAASVAGLAWLALALAGPSSPDAARAWAGRLVFASIAVIFLLSVMMALDAA
jgi:protoheme IX farnesyltransferase